jgi:hypothetical protein
MKTEALPPNDITQPADDPSNPVIPGGGIAKSPQPVSPEQGGDAGRAKPGFTPFPKSDDPKKFQFTGRATQSEADRINELLEVRSQATGKKYDIVRAALEMLDHIEADILQSYRTKKKRK